MANPRGERGRFRDAKRNDILHVRQASWRELADGLKLEKVANDMHVGHMRHTVRLPASFPPIFFSPRRPDRVTEMRTDRKGSSKM